MIPEEQARNLISHCRFCDRLGEGYKCDQDLAEDIAAVAAALQAKDDEIMNLAMLVRRLIHVAISNGIRRPVIDDAANYLLKHNLSGSPLRKD